MSPETGAPSPWRRMLELPYAAAVRLRTRYYDRPDRARAIELPVIGIGNLTVGGTGKTPFVAWLAGELRRRGVMPAVVSRGYGGRAGRGPCIVSRGDGPRVGPAVAGDEPWMLASRLDGVPVVVGADRFAAARRATTLGADVVLLDDGFQHRRLARALDIVLLDAAAPFDNGHLLPAGRLREPPDALRRAGLAVLTRAGDAEQVRRAREAVAAVHRNLPLYEAVHEPRGCVDAAGRPRPVPERAVAFCGIAQPASFRESLDAARIDCDGFTAFPDHHAPSDVEIDALVREANRTGLPLVTTEKDLARLAERMERFGKRTPLALRIALRVSEPERLLDAVATAAGFEAGR